MQKMIATIRTHSNRISAKGTALYQRALRFIGIQDCPEARITAAVTVAVALYYVCALLQAAINLITDAAPMLTAFITQ